MDSVYRAAGAPADEQRRALLGWHIGGFDDVLNADRHAVNRRQRSASAPALGGAVGSGARRRYVMAHESPDHRLELLKESEAAFEIIAGRALAAFEIRCPGEIGERLRCRHGQLPMGQRLALLISRFAAAGFGATLRAAASGSRSRRCNRLSSFRT
jgi:hypothetical protein